MCLLGFGYAPVESAGQDHPGEIEGFVRAEQSGQPLAGARVTIVGTPQFVITSSDGSFHLRVADGQYTVRVERLGYAALDTTISVRGQVDPLVIELQESALELEGLVITRPPLPASGLRGTRRRASAPPSADSGRHSWFRAGHHSHEHGPRNCTPRHSRHEWGPPSRSGGRRPGHGRIERRA